MRSAVRRCWPTRPALDMLAPGLVYEHLQNRTPLARASISLRSAWNGVLARCPDPPSLQADIGDKGWCCRPGLAPHAVQKPWGQTLRLPYSSDIEEVSFYPSHSR